MTWPTRTASLLLVAFYLLASAATDRSPFLRGRKKNYEKASLGAYSHASGMCADAAFISHTHF